MENDRLQAGGDGELVPMLGVICRDVLAPPPSDPRTVRVVPV